MEGIISALAFSADASSGVYAAGSLSPSAPTSSNIALFTELTGETPVMYVGKDSSGFGVRASVSQVSNAFISFECPHLASCVHVLTCPAAHVQPVQAIPALCLLPPAGSHTLLGYTRGGVDPSTDLQPSSPR